jgi:hypothetical protein
LAEEYHQPPTLADDFLRRCVMKSVVKLVFAIGLTSFLVINVIVVIRKQPLNKGNLSSGLEENKLFLSLMVSPIIL